MKKTDLAWAAGVFDGEGCIAIVHVPAGAAKGCKTERYTLIAKIAMCHKPTVQKIRDLFNTGTVQRGMSKGKRWNASYVWVCQSRKAIDVIDRMRPYLVTKADEADVASVFMKLPLALTGGRGGNKITTRKLRDRRRGLYWLMRSLKSRWRFYTGKLSRYDKELLRKAVSGMIKKRA